MPRIAVALLGLVCLGALAQEGTRLPDAEARRIAERYEEEVRRRAAELANMPPNVAPPEVPDDRVPVSDTGAARGHIKLCREPFEEPSPAQVKPFPLCADVEKKRREEEAARRRADEEARRKAGGSGTPGKPPRDYSKYSCWQAPDDCLVVSREWGRTPAEQKRGLFRLHLRNVCARRIAVQYCFLREGKKPWCGLTGVLPGETRSPDFSNSSGQYRVMFTGIDKGNDDFICPKPPGWKEMREP